MHYERRVGFLHPKPFTNKHNLRNYMLVTQDWIDGVTDDKGLTRGQLYLLNSQLGGLPFEGKELNDLIAKHVESCKGWRPSLEWIRSIKHKNY